MKNQSKQAAQLQSIYLQFISGEYKNCLNQIQKLTKNHGQRNFIYQHNYNICEYAQNRSALQAFSTLNKLSDLLSDCAHKKTSKKGKEDVYDGTALKYNIAVLMGVIGRRDNMEMVLRELYFNGPNISSWKYAFLLLQSQLLLDRKFECIPILKGLEATRGLPKSVSDKDEKNNKIKFSGMSLPDNSTPDQGTYSRQQYNHLLNVLKTLVYIKFGLLKSAVSVLPQRQNNKLIQGIKDGSFNYKNSNLFQLNLITMMKFASAQLQYQSGNYHKSLKLLNPGNLMEADINSNKYWIGSGHLALNNIGLINFRLQKYTLALFYISKSLQNLAKFTVVNAQERQQIICQHFQSRHEFVMYNQALLLLKLGKSKQAYQHFSSLQKSTKNYKFWYRFGQATLKFFHILLQQNSDINQSQLYSEIIDQHHPSYYYPNVPYVKQQDKKGRPAQPHKGPFYKRYILHSVDHFIEEGSVEENKKITKTESSLLHLKAILDKAQNCFENALISIEQQNIQLQVSSLDYLKCQPQVLAQVSQKKIKETLVKEHSDFLQSILIILSYISLCKDQYSKTIKLCRQILSLPEVSMQNGYNASMYLMEAYIETEHVKQALQIAQNKYLKPGLRSCSYEFRDTLAASQTKNEKVNPDVVMKYNVAVMHIRSGNLAQANMIITKLLNEMGIVPNSYLARIPTYMLNLLIYWNLRTDNPWAALQLVKHRRILSSPGNNNNKSLLKVVK